MNLRTFKQLQHFLLAIISLLATVSSFSQSKRSYRNEFSLISENDNYLLGMHDGYYTNGAVLSLRHIGMRPRRNELKVIYQYEIGQMIFNPSSYKVIDPAKMDRPFAGYLYGKFSRTGYFNNDGLLQLGMAIGTIGKSSGAETVQRSYHNLISIYKVRGWPYQLKDEPSINLSALYVQPLFPKLFSRSIVNLSSFQKMNLGNAFTNLSAGFMLRLGLAEKNSESAAWGSRLNRNGSPYFHKAEVFLFFQPELVGQLYNATVQGGLFIKDKGPVTCPLEPIMYQHRIGIQYAEGRSSVQIAGAYKTKEASSMIKNERYAIIALAYRFN